MTSGKGIELINELGDIRIKCRKLRIAGEGEVGVPACGCGGRASARDGPEVFFAVHSAWCPPGRSGMLAVELKRPEITKCEWQKDGSPISEALVGDEVTLHIETKDIEDGDTVGVEIWEHDEDNKHDHVIDLTGTVKNGKAAVQWEVAYTEDNDDSTSGQEMAEKGVYAAGVSLCGPA
jgi:hypothetical protein